MAQMAIVTSHFLRLINHFVFDCHNLSEACSTLSLSLHKRTPANLKFWVLQPLIVLKERVKNGRGQDRLA